MGPYLLLQNWVHDANVWESLSVAQQEAVIGRRKLDSEELEDKAPASHVGSTDQERFGKIFRRNMPHGTVTDHYAMFVGFGSEQRRLAEMLESMAGLNASATPSPPHATSFRRVLLRSLDGERSGRVEVSMSSERARG